MRSFVIITIGGLLLYSVFAGKAGALWGALFGLPQPVVAPTAAAPTSPVAPPLPPTTGSGEGR